MQAKKKNPGRPKANIDWLKVDNYLRSQCDGAAIARLIGIHPETLYRACQQKYKIGFTEYSTQKKAEGRELLRAKQYNIALNGDKGMLIWLGKQYLGQSDKVDATSKGDKIEAPDTVIIIPSNKRD